MSKMCSNLLELEDEEDIDLFDSNAGEASNEGEEK